MLLRKDFIAGFVFFGFAVLFGATALHSLRIGTATRMGPGYFPVLLASILALIGLVLILKGILSEGERLSNIPWRGLAAILATPLVFGATVTGLGFIPSLLLTIVVAGLASPVIKPLSIACIAVGLTAFCVAVFYYGLGISVPMFGTWLPI